MNVDTMRELTTRFRRDLVVEHVRRSLKEIRHDVVNGQPVPLVEHVVKSIVCRIEEDWSVGPSRVINATGVILHTNLARAPLSSAALAAIRDASGYSDLEFDRRRGTRGDRQRRVALQLTALTGAEGAFVTVSAASALLLALTALARRKEVIVSRGQAVEIGGGFRIPEVLRQSGAKLVEVGTTNRTRLADYAEAITPRTAAILHVHPSNFRVIGFTQSVALAELAHLATTREIPLIDDNGGGAMLETLDFGLSHEPMVRESLNAGSDLVVFSGDKLLGGPQAGIVLGRSELIDRLSKHPLARAVRPDKITLVALSATIAAYLAGTAESTVPVWQMISQSATDIARRAAAFADAAATSGVALALLAGESSVGGGTLPGETLPTTLLALPRYLTADALRMAEPPIVARTQRGRTLLDLRTVAEDEETALMGGILVAHRRAVNPPHG